MLRNILLGVGVFATILSILIFSGKIPVGNKAATAHGDVLLWGTLPEFEMNSIVQSFNPQAKTYAVRYKYVPANDFNQRLLEALASGNGPDMIVAPYQTILSQSSRLSPFPIAEKTFKDTYVDGASVLFTPKGALALPVSVDPMVLLYNRALLSKHGIVNPPTYWDEIVTMTPLLTIRQNGTFVESAIALGTPETTYAKDIIMAIIYQLGQTPVISVPGQLGDSYLSVEANEPVTTGGTVLPLSSALRFFVQFGDPGAGAFTWSDNGKSGEDMFLSEKLAMYIGYAGDLPSLRSRNPRGEFEMAVFPQTRGYNTFSTGMKMYAIGTLQTSRNLQASLTVASQFSGGGVSPSIAAITGAVSALRVYATTPSLDPVIARSMLVARGWFDSHEKESTAYTTTMISDTINYRFGVSDAASMFVSRLRDLYAKK